LGGCFLKLVKFLHKDLPLIDPCVFIRRFCSSLEFGQQQPQVELTANRLLKRMRQDWIEQGRRPSSLCGAAILISARLHGFQRTTAQIVKIVNVCDETLRKRLQEFK
jgi:transcription factor IIIB subunit 2